MTEPHAGTDVANYRTNTQVHSDRIVLNGTKTLISRADEAQWFVVFTRIDSQPGREGIGCVLLNRDTQSFEVTARYHTTGAENLAAMQLNHTEMPSEHIIIRDDAHCNRTEKQEVG